MCTCEGQGVGCGRESLDIVLFLTEEKKYVSHAYTLLPSSPLHQKKKKKKTQKNLQTNEKPKPLLFRSLRELLVKGLSD